MARTPITLTVSIGPYPVLPVTADSADVVMAALTGSSGSNGNQCAFGNFNRLLLVFQNTDGASARTVTLTSIAGANIFNRSGDVSAYSMGIGEFASFLVERNGWVQSDGNLYFEASSANVKVAIFGVQ